MTPPLRLLPALCLAFGACFDGPAQHTRVSVHQWRPAVMTDAAGAEDPGSGGADAEDGLARDGGDDIAHDADTHLDVTSPWDIAADGEDVSVEPGPEPYPADRVHSPLSPSVVAHLRAIAAKAPALQDDVFMKVGASTSVSRNFLHCLSGAAFDLGAFGHLASTRDFFLGGAAGDGDPFSRDSLAALSGRSARWAITGDPPPLLAELEAISPRYALVHFGTNDMGLGTTYLSALFPFADNLWTLVDMLLERGVIPILATIQRRLDRPAADLWVPTYNAAIAGIAAGRQVPLVDMYLANEPLPRHGLASDGIHSSVYPGGACLFTPEGLSFGMNHRNLQILTALQRVEAAVLDAEASDPSGEPLSGLGGPEDPFVIKALPFVDLRDTRDSPFSAFDRYVGCNSNADESGPEFIYRLELAAPARVRATVHDRGETDIDLHLLDETASPEGCVLRAHRHLEATLDPGVWHFAIDTFVNASGQVLAGEYIFTLHLCPPEDADCGR